MAGLEVRMKVSTVLFGIWAVIVIAMQVHHLRREREAREDAQRETDLYWQRGGRAR